MKWINVKEKLPEIDTDVLFVTKEKIMYVGSLCDWKNCNSFHYNSTSQDPNGIDDVTHWQHLIEAPKNKKI